MCVCVCVCWTIWLYQVEILQLTQPCLHYLITGQATRTMIVVVVCCRVVVLYSQENRSSYCCPEERVWSPEISHKITAHFQDSDFSSGPIVSETICGALEKESGATKYAKYFERIVCMTINYNVHIWSQQRDMVLHTKLLLDYKLQSKSKR